MLAILTGATFFFVFKDKNLDEIFHLIINSNGWFLLLGIALMIGYFLLQSSNIYYILKQLNEKITFWRAIKYTVIEYFFCAITPGASGGQPIAIYYMTKDEISTSNATIATIIQTCGIQVAVMSLGVLSLLFSPQLITPDTLFLFVLGLIINGVALLVLLLLLFSPSVTYMIIDKLFSLAEKITNKQFDKYRNVLEREFNKYRSSSRHIKQHPKEFHNAMIRSIIQMGLYFLIPFTVYHALGLSGESIFALFAMQSILFVATSGLPIPGAVGISEAVFLSLYAASFGADLVHTAVLLSRSISFYLFTLIGLLIVAAVTVCRRPNRKKCQ